MSKLPRSGHAPDRLRQEFLEVVDLITSEVGKYTQERLRNRLIRLTGKLWNCTDIVPARHRKEIWSDFGGPLADREPTTYAQASRMIRENLAREQAWANWS